jgi:hypothetical protein
MLLFVLVLLRWRHLKVNSPWTWYLLFTAIYLTIILSFMTGNIGLAMRQKIIILPYLFALFLHVEASSVSGVSRKQRRMESSEFSVRQMPDAAYGKG